MTEKIKITRKVDGKETELEVEESEILETDVRVPATPPAPTAEKTLKQSEVNALLAKERKAMDTKFKQLNDEYTAFKTGIEEKQTNAEEEAKEKVEKLREKVPEPIIKLLDKMSYTEQLSWLSDPANNITQSNIPPLPTPGGPSHKPPTIGTVI